MIIFIFILVAVLCAGLTSAKKNEFFTDYMSPKNTTTVNAIFSVLIFLSHAVTYTKIGGGFDDPYLTLRQYLGQLVVVTYLFFSGYGIMESIKKKGTPYVKGMAKNRLFRLWYHFAIVLIGYTIVRIGIIGMKYSLKDYLLAYTGYTTIGNSNWYMFVTFAMYIIIIVSFLVFRKSKLLALGLTCVLTLLFGLFEYKMGLGSQYYNTILTFPMGMIFSMAKPYFDKILMKNDIFWFTGMFLSVFAFGYFANNRTDSFVHYELFVFFAIVMLVIFMMKLNIKSTILDWFGEHIFSFFILQRIPMLLLRHFGYNKNPYIFIILCFIATVFLSVVYDEAMERLDKIVFGKLLKDKKKA